MEALQKKILAALPKDSIGRYDLLPLLSDRELSGQVADALAAPYMGKADIVVAPEALGWLLGEKIAHRLDVGMLPLRRGEKLPYAREDILVGLRTGLGYCWRALIGAEMFAAASGLGYTIVYAQQMSRSDKVLIGIFLIGAIGCISDWLFSLLIRKVCVGGVKND